MITDNQGINLSDHVDLFTKAKGTDKYICPICGGNDLSIHKSSGKYNCYSSAGDCNKEIYKFVIDELGLNSNKNNYVSTQRKIGIDFYASDSLKEFANSTYEDLIKYQSGQSTQVKFAYENLKGEQCYIIRKKYADGAKSKPYTVINNQFKIGKLDENWYPLNYRLFSEAKGKSIIITEGEKDAIITQKFTGILSTSLACGGNEYEQKLLFLELEKAKIKSAIYIYDNDDSGENKAIKLKSIADKLEFNLSIIPITYIYPNAQNKADIADYFLDNEISNYSKSKIHLQSMINKFKKEQCNMITTNKINTLEDINNVNKKILFNKKLDNIAQTREVLLSKYSSRLKFNELKKIIELDGEEAFLDDLYLEIHEDYGIKINKQITYDLAVRIAKKNSYHPVKDYLDNLTEDNKDIDIKNLSSLLLKTSDKIYDEMLYRHLIGSVARIYKSGCKLDTALIFQGKQGIGKSTFFKFLYGDDFFTDSVVGTDRDNLLIAHQNWCCELAEFDSITGKKASGELKAFLSKSVDTFREPYARSSRMVKRQFALVGSVNECEFLVDATGNRRFWIIPIESKIDTDKIKKYRDAIWYQAKQAFLNNEYWYLDNKYQKESEELNQQYLHTDSWDSLALDNYLKGFEEIGISIRDILINHLGIEEKIIKRSDEMRMSKILSSKQWNKKGKYINGKFKRVWFFNIYTKFEKKVDMVDRVDISHTDNNFQTYLPPIYLNKNEKVDMLRNVNIIDENINISTSEDENIYLDEKVDMSEIVADKGIYLPDPTYLPFSRSFTNSENNNSENNSSENKKDDNEKNQDNLNSQDSDDKKNEIDDNEVIKYRKGLNHELKVNNIIDNESKLAYIRKGLNNDFINSFHQLSIDQCCLLINNLRGIKNVIE